MSAARDRALDLLLAKQELRELNTGWCRAIDRLDESAMVALFHPDAVIDSGVVRGEPRSFAQGFIAWVRERAPVVSHSVANEWFEIDGEHARGECYVIAVSRLRDSQRDTDVLTFGRYHDRFARRDGTWRFLERYFVLDHSVAWPADRPLPRDAMSPRR